MKTIPDSGIYYPNGFIRNMLLSVEDVAGANGVKAILNMAGQPGLIGNYPPQNMEGEFDFARYSMIMGALDDLYGDKGAQILGVRAGNSLFVEAQKAMGDVLGTQNEGYKAKSLEEKIEAGLCLVRSVITKTQTTSIPRTEDGQFLYAVQYCPVCWGRTTTAPRCHITSGLLQAAVRYSTGGLEIDVKQVRAKSCGDPTCDYVIPLTPNN